jgi:uncharacterized protein YegP (UPF0339 family)
MNSNHWLAILAILGLLTAGCMSTTDTSKETDTPELTKTSDLYETLSMFDGYLERSPQDWYINGSFCAQGSCRQQLLAANGDSIVVTLTKYPSISDAQNSFNSIKKGLGDNFVSDAKIADSGYTWYKGTRSESGFLSGELVGVVDYQLAQGNANSNMSSDLAVILAAMLVK